MFLCLSRTFLCAHALKPYMDSELLARQYYAALGSDLSRHADEEQTAEEVAYIASFLEPSDVVLDVGCGYGRVSKELLSQGFEVYGCDVSEEMISLADDERFVVGSMLNLPYPDDAFSKVICVWSTFNSILNAQDQLRALKELCRVCSGMIFIDLPDGDDAPHTWQRERKGQGLGKYLVENYFAGPYNIIYVHTSDTITALCSALGCTFSLARECFGGRRRLLVRIFCETYINNQTI